MSNWPAIARRIRVPLGFAFAGFYVWLARPTPRSIALGGALALPGLILRAFASGYVQKNEALTTSGPYAYTRNPLYLGSLIIAAGFAVAARGWWIAAAMLALFVAVYLPVIHSEEEFLRQRFPQFSDYAHQVPRLWPRIPSFRHRGGSFSWGLYRKHREYNAIIGSVTLLAALAAKLLWISY